VSVAVVLVTLLGTGGAALVLLLALRVELRSALTVAVALAQIGEFSFVLTELATANGLLPEAARSPVLMAAFALVLINPALAAAAERLAAWQGHSGWLARVGRTPRPPAPGPELQGHAIIIGHGAGSAAWWPQPSPGTGCPMWWWRPTTASPTNCIVAACRPSGATPWTARSWPPLDRKVLV
jgi:hypothetical protein